MSDQLLLTSLWLVPLIGAGVVLLLPRGAERHAKHVATAFSAAALALAVYALVLYVGDDRSAASLADRAASGGFLTARHDWIPAFKIQYFLGLDGISVSLILLTSLTTLLACLASWPIEKQPRGYYSLFLLLAATMTGVFLALDLFLFYVFFEVMLLPMYFLIAIWGGEDREYAAIKFLLYTLFGSVFILVAILILYFWTGDAPAGDFRGGSFDIVKLTGIASTTGYYGRWIQDWVFVLFLVGFLVKLPSFPFHTWLPDAHVQAPTPISMILAGVLLKIGGYGMIRLAWPLAPAGALDWSYAVAALGVFSIVYGALAAMAQTDFKKLVAYSSVSHMGYVTLGLAAMNLAGGGAYYAYGVNGAMYMMLAHGITSAAMFFLVGVIYDRAHTRDLDRLGGLNDVMPVYGAVSYVIFFGSMGLPGLCGFVAEVFVVLAAFHYSVPMGILAAAAVVLTAGYILWTIQRVFLGRNEAWKGLPDLSPREVGISVPLVVLTVLMGVFPQALILRWMSPSVDRMVAGVASGATQAAGPMADHADQPPAVVAEAR
ncbi:NADH-quinone oxidoreductase subunit M [Paludisphaera sp.]|uniref:complex I subunit 4 family protein n=1 Tax=Paludisphaera sp. TaxID=2017432 RepID=UPI00301D91FB